MGWLTDLQSQLRGPVFAFLGSTWQYLLIAAIGLGWYLLYTNARRDRAAAPADPADVPDGSEDASPARFDRDADLTPGPFGRRQPRSRAASAQTPRREADTAFYPMTYDTAPGDHDQPDTPSTTDHRFTLGDSLHLDANGHDSTSHSGDSSSDSGGDGGGGDGGGGGD